jgi:hypothetical protein
VRSNFGSGHRRVQDGGPRCRCARRSPRRRTWARRSASRSARTCPSPGSRGDSGRTRRTTRARRETHTYTAVAPRSRSVSRSRSGSDLVKRSAGSNSSTHAATCGAPLRVHTRTLPARARRRRCSGSARAQATCGSRCRRPMRRSRRCATRRPRRFARPHRDRRPGRDRQRVVRRERAARCQARGSRPRSAACRRT